MFHTDTRLYTLLMVDLDVPHPESQSFTTYLHWMQYVFGAYVYALPVPDPIRSGPTFPFPHRRLPPPYLSRHILHTFLLIPSAAAPTTAMYCWFFRKPRQLIPSTFRSSKSPTGLALTSVPLRCSTGLTGPEAAERICGVRFGTTPCRTSTNSRSVSLCCIRALEVC